MDVKVPLIVQRLYRATESVCRLGLGVCEASAWGKVARNSGMLRDPQRIL